jgi:hypothetical protein
MEVLIRIVCKGNSSLREKIVSDKKLKNYNLEVSSHKTAGRNPGWAKIHSTEHNGAININWYARANTLVCRIVTKGSNKPDNIISDFMAYLIVRHRKRIKAIIC